MALRPSVFQAGHIVENLGIVGAALGEPLLSQMSLFTEQIEELT